MKRVLLLLGATLCVTSTAFAAEDNTERGISLTDANPKCMERTTDPSDPACTLKSQGAPRQYYPDSITSTPVLPGAPIMPPNPPIAREANRGGARVGG